MQHTRQRPCLVLALLLALAACAAAATRSRAARFGATGATRISAARPSATRAPFTSDAGCEELHVVHVHYEGIGRVFLSHTQLDSTDCR